MQRSRWFRYRLFAAHRPGRRPAFVCLGIIWGLAIPFTGGSPPGSTQLRLAPQAEVPSAPGLHCYKIESGPAIYYLEKSGAGLAALIDRDGLDWISFSPQPGSGAGGEFRGFPNAVHRQGGSYFHPKNQATDPSTTTVEYAGADRITVSAVSQNGQWACRYDFFPSHCTFTLTRMPPLHRYWVLYEGTPGGRFDDSDWWMTSAVREPQPMAAHHDGDIPAPEWIVFGDENLGRVLFLVHHSDDGYPDRFYPMNRLMTVFGFGRQRLEKFLDSAPQSFSIGFLETTDHAEISRMLLETFFP